MAIKFGTSIPTNGLAVNVDASNPRSYSRNEFAYALDPYRLTNSATGNNCQLSRDTTSVGLNSPVGGIAMKMVPTSTDPHQSSTNVIVAPTSIGQTWTLSVYIRASVPTQCQIFILGLNSSSAYVSAASTGQFNVDTSWQRYTFTTTLSTAGTVSAAIRLDGPDTGVALDGTTTPTIWFSGVQLEKGSSATSFNHRQNPNGAQDVVDLNKNTKDFYLSGTWTHGAVGGVDCWDLSGGGAFTANNTASSAYSISYKNTFIAWARMSADSAVTTWRTLFRPSTDHQLLVQNDTNVIGFYDNQSAGFVSYGLNAGTLGLENTWAMYTAATDGTNTTLYINDGTTNATVAYSASNNGVAPTLLYAGTYSTSQPFGQLASHQVYNRQLSVAEIKQIYNATRKRFGHA